jgi:hypothetical protein
MVFDQKICNQGFLFLIKCHLADTSLIAVAGNTKGGRITVPLTSCLTGQESAVWQLTIFVFICKTDKSKPVTQEVNGTVILPTLVFPGCSIGGSLHWGFMEMIFYQNHGTINIFRSKTICPTDIWSTEYKNKQVKCTSWWPCCAYQTLYCPKVNCLFSFLIKSSGSTYQKLYKFEKHNL